MSLFVGRERSRGQAMVEFALVAPMLFVLLIGIFEAGRFVMFLETLNNATREGARFAIVNGEHVLCPSGPLAPPKDNTCDPTGNNVKQAVVDAAVGLAASGELFVADPIWTSHGDFSPPVRTDTSSGYNTRGDYVTVFTDYTYNPVIRDILGWQILPTISISAESSLVVNY
jgi:Flp pilus assembly protein TadG